MRVAIIGSGAAGTSVGFTVRQLDGEADIKLLSAETLPEYSPCVLSRYVSGTLSRKRVFLKSLSDYRQQGIKVFLGEQVIRIDTKNKVVLSDKREISYDKLIIATGSRAVAPIIPGATKKGVFFFKSLSDADQILRYGGRRAVVIGAGPIGVEVSVALSKKGLRVFLIELEGQILPRAFDRKAALLLEKHLRNQGVEVFTEEKVLEIKGDGAVKQLVTANQTIDCDMVVLTTGMVPEVELARHVGLEVGKLGGIKVNRQMLTGTPDIYACGDCIEVEDLITGKPRLSLKWYDARLQGIVAASNCAGKYKEYPGSYQLAALNLPGIDAISMGSSESVLQTSSFREFRTVDWVNRKYYCRLILGDGRLLGAQLVGDVQYGGAVLSVMMRKDNLRNAKDLVASRRLPVISLMRLVGKYMGQDLCDIDSKVPSELI